MNTHAIEKFGNSELLKVLFRETLDNEDLSKTIYSCAEQIIQSDEEPPDNLKELIDSFKSAENPLDPLIDELKTGGELGQSVVLFGKSPERLMKFLESIKRANEQGLRPEIKKNSLGEHQDQQDFIETPERETSNKPHKMIDERRTVFKKLIFGAMSGGALLGIPQLSEAQLFNASQSAFVEKMPILEAEQIEKILALIQNCVENIKANSLYPLIQNHKVGLDPITMEREMKESYEKRYRTSKPTGKQRAQEAYHDSIDFLEWFGPPLAQLVVNISLILILTALIEKKNEKWEQILEGIFIGGISIIEFVKHYRNPYDWLWGNIDILIALASLGYAVHAIIDRKKYSLGSKARRIFLWSAIASIILGYKTCAYIVP